MKTASSASRTCMASASAVEWTTTVWMPSSLQARNTRSAISPRLAMRIFWNILFDHHKRHAVFDRLRVLDEDRRHRAGARRWDLVHRLHGLDDEQRLSLLHLLANLYEGFCIRCRSKIGGANHGRGNCILAWIGRGRCRRRLVRRGGRGSRSLWRRRSGYGMNRRRLARYAQLQVTVLHLNLGQIGVVQYPRKVADELLVYAVCFCH